MFTFTTVSLFFGGTAAATLPILLHFLMQGKPKRIDFPAVMFLVQKIETHRRNFRLKYFLLLTFRILLFALLGLALARPMLKLGDGTPFFTAQSKSGFVSGLVTSLGSQDAPIAAVIVIDTSIRMDYVSENKTRLDAAKEFALWILNQIPQNSTVAVLSCEPESAVFQVDKLAAEEKINRLHITPLGRPIAEVLRNATALLQESPLGQRELYVLSDLSVPGWDIPVPSETQKPFDGGIFVVDVSVKEPQNTALQKMTLIPETMTAQSSVRIDVQASHFGSAVTKTVELILIGNARDPAAETVRMSKTVDFPDGESQQSVSMTLAGFEPGVQQGKLRFSVHDALPMDDQCWFTLSIQPPQKVLLLAQPPVHDSTLYLRQALETIPFAVEHAPLSELAGMTMAELQEFQAVVLLDPSPLLPNVWKKLADYAAAGYGVGTFLGPHADSLQSFNDPSATEVLGTKLVRQARNPDGECWIVPGVSPIFTPFRSINPLEEFPWNAQPVYRYWELGELSPRADIAANFSDHRAAVVTQNIGRGHTVTLTTPISELPDSQMFWNDLPRGELAWMFVLLAEGIGKYLVGIGEQKFNFNVGEPVVLRPNLATLPPSCLLGTPQGTSERIVPDAGRREIAILSTTEPGNYSVRSGGLGQAALNLGFSVNIPNGATMLRKADVSILDRHFGAGRYRVVRTPQEVEQGIARRRIGQELYAVIMLALACLFAVEYLFANRIYGKAA